MIEEMWREIEKIKRALDDLRARDNQAVLPTASFVPFAARTLPSGWLLCDGSAVSRTTYANLFNALVPLVGTCTITIASPGVITLNGHGFENGDAIYLTTTGALPTGLSANTIYYVRNKAANTFELATTRGGSAINTSGSQSGTHSCYFCPWGLGDGSTTFNVPDFRGRNPVGQGTHSDTVNLGNNDGVTESSRSPNHTHSITLSSSNVADGGGFTISRSSPTGSSGARFGIAKYIIKT